MVSTAATAAAATAAAAPTTTLSAFDRLIAGNRIYAARTALHSAAAQAALAKAQAPGVLWIGCCDSRVPETTICDARAGDMFVHRSIANVVRPGEDSALAAVEFAVTFAGVGHVVVCGHTECAGARNALADAKLGPALDGWLEPMRSLRRERAAELAALAGGEAERGNMLAEWNVLRSLEVLKAMDVVAEKLQAGELQVHGLMYDVASAELRAITT